MYLRHFIEVSRRYKVVQRTFNKFKKKKKNWETFGKKILNYINVL